MLEWDLNSSKEDLDNKHSRVWSWLRMNAGGVHNTFKSNGVIVLDPFGVKMWEESGGRVSNAWATCLWERDSLGKLKVIPHDTLDSHGFNVKDLSLRDGLASD